VSELVTAADGDARRSTTKLHRTSSRPTPKASQTVGTRAITAVKAKDYIFHPYQKR
jgi:hypothetical protein